jgi:hypothetical protein
MAAPVATSTMATAAPTMLTAMLMTLFVKLSYYLILIHNYHCHRGVDNTDGDTYKTFDKFDVTSQGH